MRLHGFPIRSLGALQMTTDTALLVAHTVFTTGVTLKQLQFADYPLLPAGGLAFTKLPFRYLLDGRGDPIMPRGMRQLLADSMDVGLVKPAKADSDTSGEESGAAGFLGGGWRLDIADVAVQDDTEGADDGSLNALLDL
jgi:hypothetical protein